MSFRNFFSDKLAMPLLLRFSQSPPWPWHEELLKLDRADRGVLQEYQWDRFRSLMEDAQTNVPYYADTFHQSKLRAKDLTNWDDLLAVPTIDKHQIAANFPDRMTSSKSDRNTWQYYATSGTTDRLMVVKDAQTTSRNLALSLYEEKIQGTYAPGSMHVNIPPDACSLACASTSLQTQGFFDRTRHTVGTLMAGGLSKLPRTLAGRALRSISTPAKEMPSFGATGTRVAPELLQWYVDRIRRWHPAVLSGLPEYLLMLARYLKRTGQGPPKVGSLLPQGSLSTPGLKKEISQAFSAPVHEVYGGHEFGCIASTCEQREKLHIMMSECIVETVRNKRHVAPGELGEILITTFTNRTMPLIRYRPGDVGRLYEDHCSCGRSTKLLSVEGRVQDTIVTPKGIWPSQQIIDHFLAWPNIEFAQLVQRSENRCDLLIVENERGHTNLPDLVDSAGEFFGGSIQVRPRLVSTIKPEVSGKFRFVKSKSYQRFHEEKLPDAFICTYSHDTPPNTRLKEFGYHEAKSKP